MDAVKELEKNLKNVSSYEQYSLSIRLAIVSLKETEGQMQQLLHANLCRVIMQCSWEWIPNEGEHCELLGALGHIKSLEVITNTISTASVPASKWIEKQVEKMLVGGAIEEALWKQCLHTSSPQYLSATQKTLINGLCRLPDLLSAKRGRQLCDQLSPSKYYDILAHNIFNCLKHIYTSLTASKDCSTRFLASLVGKVSFLGHRDVFYSTLCFKLEEATREDFLWQRISHTLFSSIPQQYLEVTLDGILRHTTPSLQVSNSSWCILGDLPLTNSHAKYLLTHKYVTLRPFQDPRILIGYLASKQSLRPILVECLLVALKLWSDKSSLRHMTETLHHRLSGLIILAMTVVNLADLKLHLSEIQEVTMLGIQVHLENPVEEIRYIGMTTGEHIMNKLQPSSEEPLNFSYPLTDVIKWLKSFMKPLDEQEKELVDTKKKEKVEERKQESSLQSVSRERYGEGFVQTSTCDDSDDDDLEPYDMRHDPDSNQAPPPRYLRICLQDLLSNKDSSKHNTALKSVTSLIQARPPDLLEICTELAKVLLHLEDKTSMEDFIQLRLEALIELSYHCPSQVAPYLCKQFYSPHYSLKQRMDILEVLNASALKLSSPSIPSNIIEEENCQGSTLQQRKPWQEVVEERIKAKTRIISKGSRKSHQVVANKFSDVCGHFFFPLMVHYDTKIPTLDLPGRDSLLLGNLLHTLGTIIHAAVHCPLVPVMSAALIDFCWPFKYHTDVSVRQGVLYCVCCLLSVISPSLLMDKGLDEMLLWIKDVVLNDANQQCRNLASLSLSLFHESTQQYYIQFLYCLCQNASLICKCSRLPLWFYFE